MLVSITGTGDASGKRTSGPTSQELSLALRECGREPAWRGSGSATQMLLADIAKHFSAIRIIGNTEVDGHWHSETIVNVQSFGNAPVHLKVEFHLQIHDGSWVISAARLLQG